jgi:hypothetical protein
MAIIWIRKCGVAGSCSHPWQAAGYPKHLVVMAMFYTIPTVQMVFVDKHLWLVEQLVMAAHDALLFCTVLIFCHVATLMIANPFSNGDFQLSNLVTA